MSEQNNSPKPMGGMRGRNRGGFGGPHMGPVEKARDFKGSFRRLIGYLRPHKVHLIIVLIFAIASTTFTIAAPKVSSKSLK